MIDDVVFQFNDLCGLAITIGGILLAFGGIAIVTLLVRAVGGETTETIHHETLWAIFWIGLVIGGGLLVLGCYNLSHR
jgi:hypothetical protein